MLVYNVQFAINRHCALFRDTQHTQHDCQEFLTALLDMLHEDLNTAEHTLSEHSSRHASVDDNLHLAPLKDSDGRPDHIVAEEVHTNKHTHTYTHQ